MASLQESHSRDDLNVFVAFHVPADQAVATAIVKLDRMLTKVFGDTQVRETTSPEGLAHHEVIYRVQKPAVVAEESLQDFFEGLSMVFTTFKDMHPHFTQISEETLKGDTK
jgi:hypothetical protein